MPRNSTTLAPWAAQQNSHHDLLQQEMNELKEQLEHVKSVVVATQEAISKRHSLKLKNAENSRKRKRKADNSCKTKERKKLGQNKRVVDLISAFCRNNEEISQLKYDIVGQMIKIKEVKIKEAIKKRKQTVIYKI